MKRKHRRRRAVISKAKIKKDFLKRRFEAIYHLTCYYHDKKLDRRIPKIVGRQPIDPVAVDAFLGGMRDLSFYFDSPADTIIAVLDIRKAKLRSVRIMLDWRWEPK